jgi:hypothetical protein
MVEVRLKIDARYRTALGIMHRFDCFQCNQDHRHVFADVGIPVRGVALQGFQGTTSGAVQNIIDTRYPHHTLYRYELDNVVLLQEWINVTSHNL